MKKVDKTRYPDWMTGNVKTFLSNDTHAMVMWGTHIFLYIQNVDARLHDVKQFIEKGDTVNRSGFPAIEYNKEKDYLVVWTGIDKHRLVLLMLNSGLSINDTKKVASTINEYNIRSDEDGDSLIKEIDVDTTLSMAFSKNGVGSGMPDEKDKIQIITHDMSSPNRYKVRYNDESVVTYIIYIDKRTKAEKKAGLPANMQRFSGFIVEKVD